MTIVVYVSGHGFGHATRTAAVLAALKRMRSDVELLIRTQAPPELFRGLAETTVSEARIDPGVVESRCGLEIRHNETIEKVKGFMSQRQWLIRREVALLSDCEPSLIIADIPFIAGDVGAALGLPCVGIANFTWDWIYEPLLSNGERWREQLLSVVREGYGRFNMLLRLPMHHDAIGFRSVKDMPLVCRTSTQTRASVRERLGISIADNRPLVLVGLRVSIDFNTVVCAAKRNPGLLFVTPDKRNDVSGNCIRVALGSDLNYLDILKASDAVVAKLGYGIIADCVANQTALAYPPRSGFREDDILRQAVRGILPATELPLPAFREGEWSATLDSVLNERFPSTNVTCNGAEACACELIRFL